MYKKKFLFMSTAYHFLNYLSKPTDFSYVITLSLDFIRNSWLALVYNYKIGFFYIIAPVNLNINSKLVNFSNSELDNGTLHFLRNIPINYRVYNINFIYGRSSGSSALLVSRDYITGIVELKMASKKIKKFKPSTLVFLGVPSYGPKFYTQYFKAGHNKLFGLKSSVRGVAKNPVDHPHGGGEGKKSPNVIARSPWGQVTKNVKIQRNRSH